MPLVQPRSLQLPDIRTYPRGRVYRVINEGYGLMPSYAVQLSLSDRWAVVAYVRALELSQSATLNDLPDDLKKAAQKALP